MNGQRLKKSLTSLTRSLNLIWIPVQHQKTINVNAFTPLKMMDFPKNGGGCRVFCNPPYSQIAKWVEKAFRETREDNTLVVLLIPSRTDTRYFHDFIYQRAEIRFVKGRLKFGDGKGSAPFPSMVVIFRGAKA